jgi:hypothetical protein
MCAINLSVLELLVTGSDCEQRGLRAFLSTPVLLCNASNIRMQNESESASLALVNGM